MTLVLRYAVRSDVGLLREGNEDSAYAGPRLLAVADGMGGHAAGEVASALVIGSMAELDSEHPDGDMLTELSSAVSAANMRLQEMIIANPAVEGMGTTLTAVLWSDGHAAVCHIGDSRGYLLRDGELYQITHDHTLVQSLVDEGRISADDVSTHPQRSLLLRALDGRTVAEPDLSVHEAQSGDRYLLCSDGLSGVVSDETLRETLASIPDPDAATRRLIELAIRGGGPDNITCIVADVVDAATTRMPPMLPAMAGAAANGTAQDLRLAASSTGPRRVASSTAPQPILTDDDDPQIAANGNGSGPSLRRSHRARPLRRRRWPIVTTALVVLVAVVVGGGYIGYRYTQDQYYVAVNKGQVIIYRGINQRVLGISLSSAFQATGIQSSQVPSNYSSSLASTISASSLPEAHQAVDKIQGAVTQCHQQYTALQAWATAQNNYQAALARARKDKKPTNGIKPPPGPAPSAAGPMCPPSTAYGIPAAAIKPAPGTSP